MIDRLDENAVERVGGPAWESIRSKFFEISEVLLAVSPNASSQLTTIYVKYCPTSQHSAVFAVAWLKTSKKVVVGMALPDDVESELLGGAPQGMKYKGLTKYFSVTADDVVPEELSQWAKLAYESVMASAD